MSSRNAEPFEIWVSNFAISVEDYDRAQRAPKSHLPKLSAEEKAMARRFRIPEEQYARRLLAEDYGRDRQKDRGRRLGEGVQDIVTALARSGRVVRVAFEKQRARWVVRVESSGGPVDIAIPCELADDYLDYVFPGTRDQLKGRVSEALGAVGALAEQ
jgi:hypothetical protein